MTLSKLAVLLAAVTLAATGQLVLKHGMVEAQRVSVDSGRSLLLVAASSWWIIGGLMIFGASAVAWLLTLAHVPLSVAYPFNSLGYIAILFTSAVVLHERTNLWMWLGTVLVALGLLLIVTMAPAAPAVPATPPQTHLGAASVNENDAHTPPPEPGSIPLPPHRAK